MKDNRFVTTDSADLPPERRQESPDRAADQLIHSIDPYMTDRGT